MEKTEFFLTSNLTKKKEKKFILIFRLCICDEGKKALYRNKIFCNATSGKMKTIKAVPKQ